LLQTIICMLSWTYLLTIMLFIIFSLFIYVNFPCQLHFFKLMLLDLAILFSN
jgi:hypothetical protein